MVVQKLCSPGPIILGEYSLLPFQFFKDRRDHYDYLVWPLA